MTFPYLAKVSPRKTSLRRITSSCSWRRAFYTRSSFLLDIGRLNRVFLRLTVTEKDAFLVGTKVPGTYTAFVCPFGRSTFLVAFPLVAIITRPDTYVFSIT